MSLVKDAGLQSLHTHLGCKMSQAPQILEKALNGATAVSQSCYRIRTSAIQEFRDNEIEFCADWAQRFQEMGNIESELNGFLTPASEDLKKLQDDAMAQISFQHPALKCLNFIPYILTGLTLFKIWAVPLMAILTPLLVWVLPYIFLKFFYKLPISAEQYTQIVRLMMSGNPFQFKPTEEGGIAPVIPSSFTFKSILQNGVMFFSFAHGLIQPIQNAMHLYKTDQTLYENGAKAIRFYELYKGFLHEMTLMNQVDFPFRESLDDMDVEDPRRAIHLLIEQPERFRIACRDIADLEVVWRISKAPFLSPAMIIEQGDFPLFQVAGATDLSLLTSSSDPVSSTVEFTGVDHHAVLTGPNGGGKSSFLRALLQCVLIGQAYGVAPADKMVLRRFGWISSGLRLQDAPGTRSMFETEVAFAARLLRLSHERGPGFVIYDELFHSTNPPDGIRTAKVFLKQLWSRSNILSVVSTHVFDLVEAAPESVQRLCCQATQMPDGKLKLFYAVNKGVCRLSSVQSIWERFGLVGSAPRVPAAKP